MPALPLKSMSIEKLFQLQSQVEAALTAKVVEERRELETKLAHLSRLGDGHARPGRPRGALRRTDCRPEYRNPENSSKLGLVAGSSRVGLRPQCSLGLKILRLVERRRQRLKRCRQRSVGGLARPHRTYNFLVPGVSCERRGWTIP